MPQRKTILIVSDIHYACEAEQARGYPPPPNWNAAFSRALQGFRRFVWMGDLSVHNRQLDSFLRRAEPADFVVSNGDYSCNTGFTGVSDAAAFNSARLCLEKLRRRFDNRLLSTLGDHELGKMTVFGGRGGLRLASWRCATEDLGLPPFWQVEIGCYVLIGVASPLLAFPVYEAEALPEERGAWWQLREAHLDRIRRAFTNLGSTQRVLLFCHDPTALPFLWQEEAVRSKLPRVEQTFIGHLHTHPVHWAVRGLSGMPVINCLGPAVRRLSRAVRDARCWRHFRPRLCPSLAGIELLKDGGYCKVELVEDGSQPARCVFQRLAR